MKARTHEDHLAITLKQAERHYYIVGQSSGKNESASELTQTAAEGKALLREIFKLGRAAAITTGLAEDPRQG
ncbi:hypothetical protein D3C72_2264710 [compost metagenome]